MNYPKFTNINYKTNTKIQTQYLLVWLIAPSVSSVERTWLLN
jgi:hypothetical protein